MPRIRRETLLPLEGYARERQQFRRRVLEHKTNRTLALGPNVMLVFEDELTMRYQIQEMLRIERIFEEEGIQSELDAYNPLIPDGDNWKATMLIEYPDPAERQRMLARLIGIEDRAWIQIEGCTRVFAIADEDIDRENEGKTSAVHFLRFQLTPDMVARLQAGAGIAAGIDHRDYSARVDELATATRASLLRDLA